ncbi:hypothetical protein M378DRAFT_776219 [Amanita muscaria Koide BX008]|uniref:Uncharacterized protein n=1 Tax=Amanita muscaria (strain Koide BX008) TaxID=946122 RepID=A0A0C2T0I2_AMAMK|nr:hypothetical protein M378DRAFT_776219 [Amanita muscaria Koide BX008]
MLTPYGALWSDVLRTFSSWAAMSGNSTAVKEQLSSLGCVWTVAGLSRTDAIKPEWKRGVLIIASMQSMRSHRLSPIIICTTCLPIPTMPLVINARPIS